MPDQKPLAPLQTTEFPEEATWYYADGQQRLGPVSSQQIINFIKAKKLTYGSMVWNSTLTEWIALEHSEFKNHLTAVAPPPLTGKQVNNTWIWILAFAPLIGYTLEWFVAGAVAGFKYQGQSYLVEAHAERAMQQNSYWYITIILNLALSFWDERKLKLAGIDTTRFKGWVWLIPVYMYQRAYALKQNLAYFIVWLICFVIILLA
ncbi:hypothetical protein CUZ56_01190 [Saezia sanguinis]|uniref:GYF domain-containing protein n=1 Tax=Saezia sanguinis TaxID=1965230 RepID=A0A433SET2_9BURK|nr:DUF4339 domain-containing protein [Saezia sanguinis]RUS67247.1 hypothetical protein CUZ56_01190 [Saezia sanguinis]